MRNPPRDRGGAPLAARPPSQAVLEAVSRAAHPHCLLCGERNPLGLKLRFRVDSDGSVWARLPCRRLLQGYPHALHGGVVAALLDAAMVHALFAVGIQAVTADLNLRFLAPVNPRRTILVRGLIDRASAHSLFFLRGELRQDQQVLARASAKFMSPR